MLSTWKILRLKCIQVKKHWKTGIEVSCDENDNDHEKPEEYSHSEAITLECERQCFENEDKPLWEFYNLLNQELLNLTLTNSEDSNIKSVENMKNTKKLRH